VNQPDFEINATLRALKLTVLVAPEAQVEGQEATLERQGTFVSELQHDHTTYEDLVVEKEVTGRLSEDHQA
jgi:hypothetical protein